MATRRPGRARAGRPAPAPRRTARSACRPGSRRTGRAWRRWCASVGQRSAPVAGARPSCRVGGRQRRAAFTAMIGLRRDSRRAIRVNLRGLPNDSRYSSTTVGARVVLPVLQQVVAATRRAWLPTSTNVEMPRPDPAGVLERGDAQRARLGQEADRPGRARRRSRRGVQRTSGVGVDHTERLGTDDAHAVAAGPLDERPARPRRPADRSPCEPGADDHQAVHPLAAALVDDVEHARAPARRPRPGRPRRGCRARVG